MGWRLVWRIAKLVAWLPLAVRDEVRRERAAQARIKNAARAGIVEIDSDRRRRASRDDSNPAE